MNPDEGKRSRWRKSWLPIGGFVAFLVVFQLVENLVRPEPSSSTGEDSTGDAAGTGWTPAPPELRRLADGAIEIRHDVFRRSTIRLSNEKDADALHECLERGIEDAFGEGTEGWDPGPLRSETQRILDGCLAGVREMTVPPRPPGR